MNRELPSSRSFADGAVFNTMRGEEEPDAILLIFGLTVPSMWVLQVRIRFLLTSNQISVFLVGAFPPNSHEPVLHFALKFAVRMGRQISDLTFFKSTLLM
jgi:hypothetical protein